MLFAGKHRQELDRPQEEKSLYPVLHVARSLKEYQKELVKKEVASLSELSLVGSTFSGVLKEADHFQEELQKLGESFPVWRSCLRPASPSGWPPWRKSAARSSRPRG